jgi:ATP-dependent Lhr-like helicase
MLATTRTVIIDEIHALAPNKRGSHAIPEQPLDVLAQQIVAEVAAREYERAFAIIVFGLRPSVTHSKLCAHPKPSALTVPTQ